MTPVSDIHTREIVLDDLRVADGAQSQAAVLRRDGGAEQAELAHLLDQLAGVLVGVLELEDDRARRPAPASC